MVNPGKLDQRITFQAQSRTSDGAGGSALSYADVATNPTVWAAVEARRSRERTEEGRVNAAALYKFTARYRDDIDETHQILWRGEAYNIRNVLRSSGRDLYLVIEAERGI